MRNYILLALSTICTVGMSQSVVSPPPASPDSLSQLPVEVQRTYVAGDTVKSIAIDHPSVDSEEYLRNPLPERWLYVPDHVLLAPTEDKWWQEFDDDILNNLIERAVTANFNVSAALKRIEMARKEMNSAASGYYPSLGLTAGWNREQNSGAVSTPVMPSTHSDYFSAGISMNWEIDVFGRIRSKVKALGEAVKVSKADYEAVMISLCANVAKAYFELRTYQTEYNVALTHIQSQEKILRITEARLEAGIGDMLEVTQARMVLYSTKASVPGLEAMIRTTANSIAVMIGEYPLEIVPTLLKDKPLPTDKGLPSVGLPIDLLRRRPDIVEAEYQIAQYAALCGVAKKDFLPTLSLSGSIGTSSHNLKNLFGAHSMDYSIAPTLSWTIFDGFARKNAVAEARLRMEEGIDNYNMLVANAVQEVANAITRYNSKCEQCGIYEELVEQSSKALELSLDLYKQGLTAFSNVVDAQQSYLSNQNSLISARGDALSAIVSLYQATGGGY